MSKEKYLPSTLTNDSKVSVKGKSIKELAKELCEKSHCHHKCHDTKDCVVEDEALLLINENKSNNFDVKSNNEIEEMAQDICGYCTVGGVCILDGKKCDLKCSHRDIAEKFYNAGYRKQSEWISVEDRLPEESGEYLVFGRTFGNKKPQIWICECISIGSVIGWCNNAKNPIIEAWMPLPEAPKMKGGE